jgi:hypothetical protein
MYSTINFPSKKALKEAVTQGRKVTIFQPNDMVGNPKAAPDYTGSACLEGPHYPKAHSWYATVQVTQGVVTKVS